MWRHGVAAKSDNGGSNGMAMAKAKKRNENESNGVINRETA